MDDKTIDIIVANDREWRKYLITVMERNQKRSVSNAKEIRGLIIWNRIWRSIGAFLFTLLLYFIKTKF